MCCFRRNIVVEELSRKQRHFICYVLSRNTYRKYLSSKICILKYNINTIQLYTIGNPCLAATPRSSLWCVTCFPDIMDKRMQKWHP